MYVVFAKRQLFLLQIKMSIYHEQSAHLFDLMLRQLTSLMLTSLRKRKKCLFIVSFPLFVNNTPVFSFENSTCHGAFLDCCGCFKESAASQFTSPSSPPILSIPVHPTPEPGGGGTRRKPRCHGRSALTSSVGYTHPTMTVRGL